VSDAQACRAAVQAAVRLHAFHDETVRNVKAKRVQVDEIWSFTYAKQRNAASAIAAPDGAGDTWTWTGIDADSKLIVSWFIGARDGHTARLFIDDLKSRLANRVQLTSDGLRAYLDAVEDAFGADIDYAQLHKIYGPSPEAARRYSPPECIGCETRVIEGNPDPEHISTSYVERHNLTMRMSMRRFTRLTNAFSKKLDNHKAAVALYFMWYNFIRIHKTLRVTPAMEAKVRNDIKAIKGAESTTPDSSAVAPRANGS
jgi:IS1 family transposase